MFDCKSCSPRGAAFILSAPYLSIYKITNTIHASHITNSTGSQAIRPQPAISIVFHMFYALNACHFQWTMPLNIVGVK